MIPTVDNPLILRYINEADKSRNIPALKNNRDPVVVKGKLQLRKNPKVHRFLKSIKSSLLEQWEEQGFDQILIPDRVCVWSYAAKYVDKADLPVSDLDNQYTTVQETLANPVPVIENDRQVASFYCEERLVHNRMAQHAKAWVWVSETDQCRFYEHMDFFLKNRPDKIEEPGGWMPEEAPALLVEAVKGILKLP